MNGDISKREKESGAEKQEKANFGQYSTRENFYRSLTHQPDFLIKASEVCFLFRFFITAS